MSIKPKRFNQEAVRAILNGNKMVTREIVKCKYSNTHLEILNNKYGSRLIELQNDIEGETFGKNENGGTWHKLLACREIEREYAPYQTGDILYVRETFCDRWLPDGLLQGADRYGYKADGIMDYGYWGNDKQCKCNVWIPSIHMPKEAARIFLKITDVRVERLQDITEKQAIKEGCISFSEKSGIFDLTARHAFINVWNSTTKDDSQKWDANPWVFAYEFERCEKPEGWC
jgi:hypothetical protein